MTSSEKIGEIIQNKDVIPGTGRYRTGFRVSYVDEYVFIVASERHSGYENRIVIFDKPQKGGKGNLHVFKTSDCSDFDEAKRKAKELQEELEKNGRDIKSTYGNLPILVFLKDKKSSQDIRNILRQGTWGCSSSISIDNPDDYLRPFDILVISRMHFCHYAIYLGKGYICHFTGDKMGSSNSSGMKVKKDVLKNFFDGKTKEFITIIRPVIEFRSKSEIRNDISRAIVGSYGEGKYDMFSNNCEHFVNLVIFGIRYSGEGAGFKSFLNEGPINLRDEIRKASYHFYGLECGSSSNIEGTFKEIKELTEDDKRESYGDGEARIEVNDYKLSERCRIQ